MSSSNCVETAIKEEFFVAQVANAFGTFELYIHISGSLILFLSARLETVSYNTLSFSLSSEILSFVISFSLYALFADHFERNNEIIAQAKPITKAIIII
jgi:hypothetical protein